MRAMMKQLKVLPSKNLKKGDVDTVAISAVVAMGTIEDTTKDTTWSTTEETTEDAMAIMMATLVMKIMESVITDIIAEGSMKAMVTNTIM